MLSRVLRFAAAKKIFTWMGAFGAPTPKGSLLWSNNHAFVDGLKKTIRRADFKDQELHEVTKKYTDKAGNARVTGGKGLKKPRPTLMVSVWRSWKGGYAHGPSSTVCPRSGRTSRRTAASIGILPGCGSLTKHVDNGATKNFLMMI